MTKKEKIFHEIERGKEEGKFFIDEALIEAEEEGRIHQWQIGYPELCQSLANSDTPDYATEEGTDAFFEAAWETLVNFWRTKTIEVKEDYRGEKHDCFDVETLEDI